MNFKKFKTDKEDVAAMRPSLLLFSAWPKWSSSRSRIRAVSRTGAAHQGAWMVYAIIARMTYMLHAAAHVYAGQSRMRVEEFAIPQL